MGALSVCILLCTPHIPALSILVVIGEDAPHWFCFFIFHSHGKGRRVQCGSHCQMILIFKGIKKAQVQIRRGRIFSDVLNLVGGGGKNTFGKICRVTVHEM